MGQYPKWLPLVAALVGGVVWWGSKVLAAPAVDASGLWIDVRTEQEFAQGHLAGAVNIPHTHIANQISQLTTDKHTPIYLYCRSGNRSGQAQKTLQAMGYTHVYNKGAYSVLKWQQAKQAQSGQR